MSDSSPPTRVPQRWPFLRSFLELLASMRFAISLLTVICIASVIGTVIQQHGAWVRYIYAKGPHCRIVRFRAIYNQTLDL